LEYYRSDLADATANRSGTHRLDARMVERTLGEVNQLLDF